LIGPPGRAGRNSRLDGTEDPAGGQDPGSRGGLGASLIVAVSNVDAQYERIRAAGISLDPPRDEPYGPRTCHVEDPWGYHWYFWQGDAQY
jgi:uncharacterized glyoxalase superfamily protein PhnB